MKTASIDLGNTFAKVGFFENNELINSKIGLTVSDLKDTINKSNVEQLIISSVTKTSGELEELFSEYLNKIILTPETKVPINKNYDTPETLGADRLAAAVGANFLFPNQNCLIIDMGTAIKYDYVSADGTFQGGIISPGKRIRFEALHTFTKRLPLVEANEIPPLIGKSTKTCIQSGVINGIVAEVNGIVENYGKLGQFCIILCGGDAQFFESQIKKANFVTSMQNVPNLVLIGLNTILNFNIIG